MDLTPTTWNHRVLLTEEHGEKSYCIHEVHYNKDGLIIGWTADPIAVCSGTLQGLIWQFDRMREAFVNAASNFPKCAEVKFPSWADAVISRPDGDRDLHFWGPRRRGGCAGIGDEPGEQSARAEYSRPEVC